VPPDAVITSFPSNADSSNVTRLLRRAQAGDASACESFWRLVHADLRAMASGELDHERRGHTLPPTALVNEAFLRLQGPVPLPWQNRAHFFGAAARAMRRVLVDHARARRRRKRNGGNAAVPLSELELAAPAPGLDLLALDEALEHLGRIDQRMVQVVELRFFAGLPVETIAQLLGVSTGTVGSDWKIARMWLHRELSKGEADGR
jgi:RNA polymerase sigma factor (TIGR02999 family)